jgi:hypothetical protein
MKSLGVFHKDCSSSSHQSQLGMGGGGVDSCPLILTMGTWGFLEVKLMKLKPPAATQLVHSAFSKSSELSCNCFTSCVSGGVCSAQDSA